jgi:hypothetical protein
MERTEEGRRESEEKAEDLEGEQGTTPVFFQPQITQSTRFFNAADTVSQYSIILIILCLAAMIIGLCTSLLTRSSSSSSSSTDSSASSSSASGAASSPSASQSSAISSSLSTCLSKWSSASASPTSYPCSDCVPVLSSTTNDYDTPLVNGNSTGVGAALQFCAMMDVYRSSNQTALGADGWAKNASPCGWKGATCDARGRITQL